MQIGAQPVSQGGGREGRGGNSGNGVGAKPRTEEGGEGDAAEHEKDEGGFHESSRILGSRRAVIQSASRLKKRRSRQ